MLSAYTGILARCGESRADRRLPVKARSLGLRERAVARASIQPWEAAGPRFSLRPQTRTPRFSRIKETPHR